MSTPSSLEINRTVSLSDISNEPIRDTISSLLAEHVRLSNEMDTAKARKDEIMLIIKPLAEALQLKSITNEGQWTLSRNKGKTGATAVSPSSLVSAGIPANALIASIKEVNLKSINVPKLVMDFQLPLDFVKAAISGSSTKADDGEPFYTVRRANEKESE